MKQTLLTLSAIVASAATMYGQASAPFDNLQIYPLGWVTVDALNQGPSGGIAGDYVGADYSIQLLWKAGTYTTQAAFDAASPSSSGSVSFFGVTGSLPNHGPTVDGAGLFDGGAVQLGGPAGTYTMQVRAWFNGGVYTSYDAALVSGKNAGRSALITTNATVAPSPMISPVWLSFTVGTLPGPPSITSQPQSQSVYVGSNATFSVTAVGSPFLSYQWRKNSSVISNATQSSYTLTNVTINDAGHFDVIVTNTLSATNSARATLQVLPFGAPSIQINGQLAVGTVPVIPVPTVTITGGFPGGLIFYTLDGSTPTPSSTFYFRPFTIDTNVVIQAMSLSADFTQTAVAPAVTALFPPGIAQQPQSQVVIVGSNVTFSVAASGVPPFSYQWRKGGADIGGAVATNYSIIGVTTNDAGGFDVVVSNPYGSTTSDLASVTVYIPVSIANQPLTQVVPAYGTATFNVGATGLPAPQYQWLFNGVDIPGATGTSLVITNVGTNVLGDYHVEAWNAYSAATSSVAYLVMSPTILSPFIGATAVWGKDATLSVSALGSGDLTYQWFKDGVLVTGATNDTLAFPAVQISDGGLYSVVVSSPWGSETNTPALLVVNPANISLGLYAGVTIEGVAGYTYGIEYSTNLANINAWVFVTNVTLTQPVEIWVDTSAEVRHSAKRFYRVTAY